MALYDVGGVSVCCWSHVGGLRLPDPSTRCCGIVWYDVVDMFVCCMSDAWHCTMSAVYLYVVRPIWICLKFQFDHCGRSAFVGHIYPWQLSHAATLSLQIAIVPTVTTYDSESLEGPWTFESRHNGHGTGSDPISRRPDSIVSSVDSLESTFVVLHIAQGVPTSMLW